MPKKLCRGYFSDEAVQALRESQLKGELIPLLSQRCAKCGRKVVAKNKAGQWVPETHFPLSQKSSNRSGKSGCKR